MAAKPYFSSRDFPEKESPLPAPCGFAFHSLLALPMLPIEIREPPFGFRAKMCSSGPDPFCKRLRVRKGQQMKKAGSVLILCLSTLSLPACLSIRNTGPCYGTGCPSFLLSMSAQSQKGDVQKGQATNAQDRKVPDKKEQHKKAQAKNGAVAQTEARQGR